MGHKINSDVTSNNSNVRHTKGLNFFISSYTLSETASASVTIAMCRLPPGARIVTATLTHDNNALDATGAGSVSLQSWTNGNLHSVPVQTAAASIMEYPFNPLHDGHGIRHTASSHVVVKLSNFAATGTGTATTIFTVSGLYDSQKEGD